MFNFVNNYFYIYLLPIILIKKMYLSTFMRQIIKCFELLKIEKQYLSDIKANYVILILH